MLCRFEEFIIRSEIFLNSFHVRWKCVWRNRFFFSGWKTQHTVSSVQESFDSFKRKMYNGNEKRRKEGRMKITIKVELIAFTHKNKGLKGRTVFFSIRFLCVRFAVFCNWMARFLLWALAFVEIFRKELKPIWFITQTSIISFPCNIVINW